MWEAIARNRRRSWLLIILMGVLLLALGAALGALLVPAFGSYHSGSQRPGIDALTAGMYGAGAAAVQVTRWRPFSWLPVYPVHRKLPHSVSPNW